MPTTPLTNIGNTRLYYEALWDNMVIKDNWKPAAIMAAKTILTGRLLYEKLCQNINPEMPWYVPGIIHMLEGSCNFKKHLHNGDSLSKRTVHVPAGRPVKGEPPFTWLDSAADALTMKGIQFDLYKTWDLDQILYRLEGYNGLGYRNRGILTPYLWSGTNHYTKGKYGSDNKYNPDLVSNQVGASVLLRYVTDKTLHLV